MAQYGQLFCCALVLPKRCTKAQRSKNVAVGQHVDMPYISPILVAVDSLSCLQGS